MKDTNTNLTKNTAHPVMEPLIQAAMEDSCFMEFVECEGGERVTKDIEAFFTDYSDLHIEDQFDDLKNHTLIRMWRFYVAYMLDLKPYEETTNYLLRNEIAAKWTTHELKTTITHKFMQKLVKLDNANKAYDSQH